MSVLTSPRRVTVVTPTTRVDVSLPVESTVAELVPQLVRMTDADANSSIVVGGFILCRLGEDPLDAGLTVSEARISDGELLYLRPRADGTTALLFDDVVDAIASAAQTQPGVWRTIVARRVAMVVAALGFLGAAVAIAALDLAWPWRPILTGVLALVLLVSAGALARAYGDAIVGSVIGIAGITIAFGAGLEIVDDGVSALRLALGFSVATVYSVLALIVVADRQPWFTSAAAACAVGAVATISLVLFDSRPLSVAAIVIVVVTALCPLLPSTSLRLAKLPFPEVPTDVDAFRRDEGPTLDDDVIRETRAAEAFLTGLLAAAGAIVVVCVVVLFSNDNRWGWLLAALAGIALTLRSRSYSGTGQRLVLLVAGTMAMVSAALRPALDITSTRPVLLGVLLVVGASCTVFAVRSVGRNRSPYWGRVLDIVEFLALTALAPVAAAVLGVYAHVRGWGG